MSKTTKPVAVAEETKTANVVKDATNSVNGETTPEQTANVAELNEKSASATPKPAPTIDELKADWKAKQQIVTDLMNADEPDTDKLFTAQIESSKASQQYKKAVDAEKSAAAAAELEEKRIARANMFWDAISALGFSVDDKTIENQPVQVQDVIRELTTKYAAPGQTGKSLVKASNGSAPRETGGSTRTDEIMKLMDSGSTYQNLIDAGYADGTIRSAAWKGGYKKNADGTYYKG